MEAMAHGSFDGLPNTYIYIYIHTLYIYTHYIYIEYIYTLYTICIIYSIYVNTCSVYIYIYYLYIYMYTIDIYTYKWWFSSIRQALQKKSIQPPTDEPTPSVSSFLPCKHSTVRLQLAGGSSWPKVVVPTPKTVSEPTIP